MKTYVLAICLLLYAPLARTQYLIRYDVAREQIQYLRIKHGDTVATPVIRLSADSRVNLQLVNATNSYRKQIGYRESTIDLPPPVIPFIGNTIQKIIKTGAGNDTKSVDVADIFKKNSNEKFNELGVESAAQKAAKEAFAGRYNEFNLAYARWQRSQQQVQLYEGLWKDLAVLRYTLQMPAGEIKQTAREKTAGVFPGIGDDAGQITLQAAAESPAAMTTLVQAKYNELKQAYEALRQSEVNPAGSEALFRDVTSRVGLLGNRDQPPADPSSGSLARRIAALYGAILNDSYGLLTPLTVNAKTEAVELRFIPDADSATAAAAQLRLTDTVSRWIPVVKTGPLRFRNTIGFSFVSFKETRSSYYVSGDSVVRKETGDQYQPVIVTYLHFYSPKDKGFRWGGSLGAGIPVGGDENKLNIMLGLSTFLGRNDPVSISIGLSGAQVKTLSGWHVGEKLPYDELKPKDFRTVYRVGYFLAISFNPSALAN